MNARASGGLYKLEERHDGFAYNYRMHCGCGKTSPLTAAEYFSEMDNACTDCAHCGDQIHFGPAVAALRDENDPALRDECVPSLAWYHTSTSPDWPAADYASLFDSNLKWVDRHAGLSRESYVARQTSKALHVGTYEAAIENMLRRMRNQADSTSQFYLYRVALRLGPGRMNEGYRDENHAIAADISVRDLDRSGLDAVRYLNVHEAAGTLSLALRKEAIAAVQQTPVPIFGLSVESDSDAVRTASETLMATTRALSEAEAAVCLDARDRRRMQLGTRPDPEGVAKRIGDLELGYYRCWNDLTERLADAVLPNVSPIVRRNFNEAIAGKRSKNDGAATANLIARYQQLGALLENAGDVMTYLAQKEWRVVGTAQTGRQSVRGWQ